MGKSPSGTRESWKTRNTCLAVGTMSLLERNMFRVLDKLILFLIFTKSNYMSNGLSSRLIFGLGFVPNVVLCSVLPRQVEQNWVCDFFTIITFASEHENGWKYLKTFLGTSPASVVSQSPQDWSPGAVSSSSCWARWRSSSRSRCPNSPSHRRPREGRGTPATILDWERVVGTNGIHELR